MLRDIDLALPPRARIAVVGETGSGKTTLAKLLTRLMDPTRGRVLLDGVDLRDVRFASLRERVVLVPQEGFLFDDTLRANIACGTDPDAPTATQDDVAAPSPSSGCSTGLARLRTASTPRSASAARRSPRGSGSSSRSPGPTSPTPTCSCSTRPPRRWTRPPRCGWPGRWRA